MTQARHAETLIEIASRRQKEREYWHRVLGDLPAPAAIQRDFVGVAGTPEPREVAFVVPPGICDRLRTMSKGSDHSLHILWLASLAILLARYSRRRDVLIGTPIYRQSNATDFCNTILPLRIGWDNDDHFRQLALLTSHTMQGALEHYAYPYEILARDLGSTAGAGAPAIFATALVMDGIQELSFLEPAAVDCLFFIRRDDHGMSGKVFYNGLFYRESTIRRALGTLFTIMGQALFDTGTPVRAMESLSPEEREELLRRFSGADAAEPLDLDPATVIHQRLRRFPHRVVVADDGDGRRNRQVTAAELTRRAGILSRVLEARGVGTDRIVAIHMERRLEFLVCVLGILAAGGAYLPLDTMAPDQRIDYIVRDSGTRWILTDGPGNRFPAAAVIDVRHLDNGDSEPREDMENGCPSGLAYVLYTSGTTGAPKGVMVERRNVCFLIDALDRLVYGTCSGPLRLSLVSPFMFDASIKQTFAALLLAHTLVIVPEALRMDGAGLLEFYNRHGIDIADGTPTHVGMLKEACAAGWAPPGVKYYLIGGEELPESIVTAFFDPFRGRRHWPVVINVYGPTECTVNATAFMVEAGKISRVERIPIGKPLRRTRVYILDEVLRPVPVGMAGELWISGAGVGRGYLNRVSLTHERFVPDPFCPGLRMYRTGDLGRWLESGDIDYLGRVDTQVKLRGYRIELGEIQHRLRRRDDVADAVVEIRDTDGGDRLLCAYLVPANGRSLDMDAIRADMEQSLPHYMIPSLFMEIAAIPLTPNGKLDRRALPRPDMGLQDTEPPKGKLEEALRNIWAGVLKLPEERVGVTANFFQLGGQSLLATTLALRVEKRLGIRLPLVEIFKHPTVRGLADYLAKRAGGVSRAVPDGVVCLRHQEKSPVNIFLIHDGSGDTAGYGDLYLREDVEWNVWGIRAPRPETMAPQNLLIPSIAASYIDKIEALALPGPVHLVGWSLGGTIAFEMALQWRRRPGKNGFLLLIDAPGPASAAGVDAADFSLQTEIELLRRHIPHLAVGNDSRPVPDLGDFWAAAAGHLSREGIAVRDILQLLPPDFARLIPHHERLGVTGLLELVNLNRSLVRARALYKPAENLTAPLYFLKARQTPGDPVSEWQSYCDRPVRSLIVDGDHFSIMKHPACGAIVVLLKEILADRH